MGWSGARARRQLNELEVARRPRRTDIRPVHCTALDPDCRLPKACAQRSTRRGKLPVAEQAYEQLTTLPCFMPEEMNLRTTVELSRCLQVPIGLFDHTIGVLAPAAAVALGARLVEKHLTLSRARGGPDAAFSLEPAEFKAMVDAVRTPESALGGIGFGPTTRELDSLVFRRSLFVVQDVRAGDCFTGENIRSVSLGGRCTLLPQAEHDKRRFTLPLCSMPGNSFGQLPCTRKFATANSPA